MLRRHKEFVRAVGYSWRARRENQYSDLRYGLQIKGNVFQLPVGTKKLFNSEAF